MIKLITIKTIFILLIAFNLHGNVSPTFKNNLEITAKAYTSQECECNLNRNLLRKGYQPIEITLENHTSKTYFLSLEGVDIKTVKPEEIVNNLHMQHVPKAVAFKVAGFFFWPLIIPGTIDGIITMKTHLNLKRDYKAKSIKMEKEPLIPYSKIHRVIFVKRATLAKSFTIHLKEDKSHKIHPFSVKINS